MGDVAAILGVARGAASSVPEDVGPFKRRMQAPAEGADDATRKPKKKKVSREVSALLGGKSQEIIAPMVPVRKIALGGFKAKASSKSGMKWEWKQFTSSARRDGLALNHWVRADAEFTDYPFARFNKKSDVIKYSEYEYAEMIEQDNKKMPRDRFDQQMELWPSDHTDHLFDLARRFDLRWPLIADRWEKKPAHQPEDLKRRFFYVTRRILEIRRVHEQSRMGVSPYETFEYKFEQDKIRRKQLEASFLNTNKTHEQEQKYLKELSNIETQIRKLERKITSGQFRTTTVAGLGAGAGASSSGAGLDYLDGSEEMYAGSDLMAARNLATKVHAPFVFPADSGAASGPLVPLAGRPKPPVAGARGPQQAQAAATIDRDAFTTPVSLRSLQLAMPQDGFTTDSRTLARATLAATLLQVPERPLPTGRTVLALVQLKREIAETMLLAQEVAALEKEKYRLEHLRKAPVVTGYNAPTKPSASAEIVRKSLTDAAANKDSTIRAAQATNMHLLPQARATHSMLAATGGMSSVAMLQASSAQATASKDNYNKITARAAKHAEGVAAAPASPPASLGAGASAPGSGASAASAGSGVAASSGPGASSAGVAASSAAVASSAQAGSAAVPMAVEPAAEKSTPATRGAGASAASAAPPAGAAAGSGAGVGSQAHTAPAPISIPSVPSQTALAAAQPVAAAAPASSQPAGSAAGGPTVVTSGSAASSAPGVNPPTYYSMTPAELAATNKGSRVAVVPPGAGGAAAAGADKAAGKAGPGTGNGPAVAPGSASRGSAAAASVSSVPAGLASPSQVRKDSSQVGLAGAAGPAVGTPTAAGQAKPAFTGVHPAAGVVPLSLPNLANLPLLMQIPGQLMGSAGAPAMQALAQLNLGPIVMPPGMGHAGLVGAAQPAAQAQRQAVPPVAGGSAAPAPVVPTPIAAAAPPGAGAAAAQAAADSGRNTRKRKQDAVEEKPAGSHAKKGKGE